MIKRERILLYILIAALLLIYGTSVVNADSCENYSIYVDNIKIDKNITVQNFNGFDYIPINKMQSSLKLNVEVDKTTKSIIFISHNKTIKITEDAVAIINNNCSTKLDIPIITTDNNIYVPIITLVDLFGWQVEVMNDVNCIRIRTQNNATPAGKLLDLELNMGVGKSNSSSTPYPRVAYLTFDDGLDSRITPLVLDILKEYNVKATFFIMGMNVERNKTLLKRMVEEGHTIGNHTYTHKKENIYSSAKGLKLEIDRTNSMIFNTIGIIPKLFRPPYGGTYIKKDIFKSVLNSYRTILWNVDSMDSKSTTIKSEEIVNNAINQVKNKKSAIIIMHDSSTHIETVKALPTIIRYLKDNGFTLLPIDESTNIYYEY